MEKYSGLSIYAMFPTREEREQSILKTRDAYSAYMHARNTIQGRWPEAEKFIKTQAHIALEYAMYVIKGRWPEAEPNILKLPFLIVKYAKDVVQGRWSEGEKVLNRRTTTYDDILDYAKDVIQGRWPEAEDMMKKHPEVWERYLHNLAKLGLDMDVWKVEDDVDWKVHG